MEWLEKALLPTLQAGDVVILDNATFHPEEKIINLLESAGYKALFLPRYSPRDNKIEHQWAPIKTKTTQILSTISDINAALQTVIINHAN